MEKRIKNSYLKDLFDVEYVEENPDYIIIDVFGYRNKHLAIA